MKTKNQRIHRVNLNLTAEEYSLLEKKWKASLCTHLGVYVRNILFHQPVIQTVRNRSLDDLMQESIQLKKELNAIGNNFNKTTQNLPSLHQHADFKQWLITHALEKEILFNKIDEIKHHLHKMTESWLQ